MDNQEAKKYSNILVIGNGFDLAHGLPTRYDEFILEIKRCEAMEIYPEAGPDSMEDYFDTFKLAAEHNGFIKYFLNYTNEVPGWVDMERLIKDIILNFQDFFSEYRETNIFDRGVEKCVEHFPLFDYLIRRNFGYKNYLKEKYYTEEFGLNKREVIKVLRSQLNEVIELLRLYLQNYCYDKQKGNLKAIKQISDIHPSYVISFNYTDTYKVYGIKTEDVFHVHGNLEKDNMVLGFDDDEPENLDFIYFKKYFQRIQKLTGYIDDSKFKKTYISLDENNHMKDEKPLVHFYGHSMDKTDGDIIKTLRKMSGGFVIYKCSQEDYEQKVVNLIDVFGKKDAMDMIEKGFIKFENCK